MISFFKLRKGGEILSPLLLVIFGAKHPNFGWSHTYMSERLVGN